MADDASHKSRLHKLDSIVAFLQAKFNNRLFVKLDSTCVDYFPEYSSYFGRALILLKYMYGMTNSVKLFSDEFTKCFLEASFIQYQFQMSIYNNYAPYGTNIVVLSYDYHCVYWYTYKSLVKWFVDNLGNIFHMSFLGCAH